MPAPDYKDDLVFQPDMTWEELCEWVKEQDFYKDSKICWYIDNEAIKYINEDIWCFYRSIGSIYFNNRGISQNLYNNRGKKFIIDAVFNNHDFSEVDESEYNW